MARPHAHAPRPTPHGSPALRKLLAADPPSRPAPSHTVRAPCAAANAEAARLCHRDGAVHTDGWRSAEAAVSRAREVPPTHAMGRIERPRQRACLTVISASVSSPFGFGLRAGVSRTSRDTTAGGSDLRIAPRRVGCGALRGVGGARARGDGRVRKGTRRGAGGRGGGAARREPRAADAARPPPPHHHPAPTHPSTHPYAERGGPRRGRRERLPVVVRAVSERRRVQLGGARAVAGPSKLGRRGTDQGEACCGQGRKKSGARGAGVGERASARRGRPLTGAATHGSHHAGRAIRHRTTAMRTTGASPRAFRRRRRVRCDRRSSPSCRRNRARSSSCVTRSLARGASPNVARSSRRSSARLNR